DLESNDRLTIWNASLELVARFDFSGTLADLVLGPDAKQVAVRTDTTIHSTLVNVGRSTTRRVTGRVTDFGPEGERMAVDTGNHLEVRSVDGKVLHTVDYAQPIRFSAEFAPDGSTLWAAGDTRAVRVDLDSGEVTEVAEIGRGPTGESDEGVIQLGPRTLYEDIQRSLEGNVVMFDRNDDAAQLFDLGRNEVVRIGRDRAPAELVVTPADIGPRGEHALILTVDRRLVLHDVGKSESVDVGPPDRYRRGFVTPDAGGVIVDVAEGGVYRRSIRELFDRGPAGLRDTSADELLEMADERAVRDLTAEERETFAIPER
ncbi:MAG: hypothetical protein ABEN55_22420, partial [Bradymonadaceae bacterium]